MDDETESRMPGAERNLRPPKLRVASAVRSPDAGTPSGLLTYYPFLRLFAAVAHRQFPSSLRPETRVARLRENHPRFYGICVLMDFLVVLVCAVLILATPVIALSNILG